MLARMDNASMSHATTSSPALPCRPSCSISELLPHSLFSHQFHFLFHLSESICLSSFRILADLLPSTLLFATTSGWNNQPSYIPLPLRTVTIRQLNFCRWHRKYLRPKSDNQELAPEDFAFFLSISCKEPFNPNELCSNPNPWDPTAGYHGWIQPTEAFH